MANRISQSEFVKVVAEKTGNTQKDTKDCIDAMFIELGRIMKEGGEVTINQFGKFFSATSVERNGRNPQTGESIIIAPKLQPKVKFLTTFKNYMNS